MSEFDSSRLLIVGGSARAAAASALRAGLSPVCADRFGDEDLRQIATIVDVSDDLRHSLKAILELPPMPWIYTGSLENDRKFIARVSERHTLLGNPPDVLKNIRDPSWLEQTLRLHDLPALRVRSCFDPPPTHECWLLKPTRGGGGCRIAVWSGQPLPTSEQFYFQEYRGGTSMSALFVTRSDDVEMIGVCEQLIGCVAGAPTEFGYAGSIGPITVSQQTNDLLQRLGETLAREARLRGLFGIDFVLTDGVPWLVELNPRYTASVEVIERATGRALLAHHVAAFEHGTMPVQQQRTPKCVVGKQIVYASVDSVAPNLKTLFASAESDSEVPLISDLPAPGTWLAAGWPICTVFAEAESITRCREQLTTRVESVIRAMRRFDD